MTRFATLNPLGEMRTGVAIEAALAFDGSEDEFGIGIQRMGFLGRGVALRAFQFGMWPQERKEFFVFEEGRWAPLVLIMAGYALTREAPRMRIGVTGGAVLREI